MGWTTWELNFPSVADHSKYDFLTILGCESHVSFCKLSNKLGVFFKKKVSFNSSLKARKETATFKDNMALLSFHFLWAASSLCIIIIHILCNSKSAGRKDSSIVKLSLQTLLYDQSDTRRLLCYWSNVKLVVKQQLWLRVCYSNMPFWETESSLWQIYIIWETFTCLPFFKKPS